VLIVVTLFKLPKRAGVWIVVAVCVLLSGRSAARVVGFDQGRAIATIRGSSRRPAGGATADAFGRNQRSQLSEIRRRADVQERQREAADRIKSMLCGAEYR